MGDDYQLVSPVLIIISIGLIIYLAYLLSLMFLGANLRAVENAILILVIIAAVVIVIILIREQSKIRENLNRIWVMVEEIIRVTKKGEAKEEVKPEKKVDAEKPKELPREEEKVKAPKEKVKKEVPGKEEAERERKIRSLLKKRLMGKTRKEMAKVDEEKLEEITRLLKTGAKLADTDIKKAKEAFIKAKDVYNSMSPEERRLIDKEVVKVTGLYDKIAESREKKKKAV